MECVIKAVASRQGCDAAGRLRGRWRHEISIAIQRRKAAMIRSVIPDRSASQEWLARGGASGTRLPPIHEE
eukprot:2191474-Karenia_brevis.AAC.1